MSSNSYYTSRSTETITFRGLDMSSPRFQVNQNRAMDMCNYVWRNRSVQKRYGTAPAFSKEIGEVNYYLKEGDNKTQSQFAPVYDMWFLGDTMYVHKGRLLFSQKEGEEPKLLGTGKYVSVTEKTETKLFYEAYEVPEGHLCGIAEKEALWLFTGEALLRISEDGVTKVSDFGGKYSMLDEYEDVYVPLTTMGITENGSGIGGRVTIDSANLITDRRKNGICALPNDVGYPFTYTLDGRVDPMKDVEVEISSILPEKEIPEGIASSSGRYILLLPDKPMNIPVTDNGIVNPKTIPFYIYDTQGGSVAMLYTLASDTIRVVDPTDTGREVFSEDSNGNIIYSSRADNAMWDEGLQLEMLATGDTFDLPFRFYNLTGTDQGTLQKMNPLLELDSTWVGGYLPQASITAWGAEFPLWGLFFSTLELPEGFLPFAPVHSDLDFKVASYGNADNFLSDRITAKWSEISLKMTAPTNSAKSFTLHVAKDRKPIYYPLSGNILPPSVEAKTSMGVIAKSTMWLTDESETMYYGYVTSDSLVLFDNWLGGSDGDSNITITFHCLDGKPSGAIDKCRFGILYGASGARNRLFISGNPDFPNRDWVSGEDLTYFPEDGYMDYGTAGGALCGYGIVSDGTLMAVKKEKDGEATIYYRKATVGTVTDDSGTLLTLPSGSAIYKTTFSLVPTASKTGGIAPNLFTDFAGDVLFVSSKGQIVGLDTLGTTSTEKKVVSSRSQAIDRVIEKEADTAESYVLWDDNENLYYSTKNWLYVATTDYEWFKLNIPNVTSMVKHEGTTYYGNAVGEIRRFVKESFTDVNTYEVPEGSLAQVNGSQSFVVDTTSDLYRIMTLDTPKLRKEFEKEPRAWTELTIEEREEELEKRYKNSLGELQLDFPKYDCRWYAHGYGIKGSVGFRQYSFKDSKTSFNDDGLYSYLLGKNAYVLDSEGVEHEGRFLNGTTEDDTEKKLLFNTDIALDGKYQVYFKFKEPLELEYGYVEKTNQVIFYALIEGVARFLLFPTEVGKIVLKGINPVKSYYLAAPFTAGNLCYKKAIWSYTINSDTYDENYTTIYRATDSNHIDSMVVADMGTKFLVNNAIKTKYSLSDYDLRNVTYERMRVPNTFTAFRPFSVAFVVFNFKSDLPKNSVLTTVSYTFSLAKTAFGRM